MTQETLDPVSNQELLSAHLISTIRSVCEEQEVSLQREH